MTIHRKEFRLTEHKLYHVWRGMKARCLNPNHPAYKNYGGRGVKIYGPWIDDSDAFIKWGIENGWADGLYLDKDKNGDGTIYSPDTCCFLPAEESANTRRNVMQFLYNGEITPLPLIAKAIGMNCQKLRKRISSGLSLQEAIQIADHQSACIHDEHIIATAKALISSGGSVRGAAKAVGIPYSTLNHRIKRGPVSKLSEPTDKNPQ